MNFQLKLITSYFFLQSRLIPPKSGGSLLPSSTSESWVTNVRRSEKEKTKTAFRKNGLQQCSLRRKKKEGDVRTSDAKWRQMARNVTQNSPRWRKMTQNRPSSKSIGPKWFKAVQGPGLPQNWNKMPKLLKWLKCTKSTPFNPLALLTRWGVDKVDESSHKCPYMSEWPDAELKNSPNFSKTSPKVTTVV